MHYYKARIYSPTLGRFMQTDPIGYGDGMNLYNYVGSDPINKTDPTGLERDDCPGCINVTGSRPSGPSSITSLPTMSGNFGPSRANPATIAAQLGRFGAKAQQKNDRGCPNVPKNRPVGIIDQVVGALMNPVWVFRAAALADEAGNAATARFPSMEGVGDAQDAYRHFYWVASMSRSWMGAGAALGFANQHEVQVKNPSRFRDMDTFNNWTALLMASDPKFSSLSVADLAEVAMSNKCLKVVR